MYQRLTVLKPACWDRNDVIGGAATQRDGGETEGGHEQIYCSSNWSIGTDVESDQ